MKTRSLEYNNEQRYGLITSLAIHSLIFMVFFGLSFIKSGREIKTYYLQFAQMGEETVQAPRPAGEMKKPKAAGPVTNEAREEVPEIQEPPVEEPEAVIRDEVTESPDAVKVASAPEPAQQPRGAQQQVSESAAGNVEYIASSAGSGVLETEFGSSGAPTFLRRQMPVYPMMAKKLGKQGKVILRLHINEKGRLLNVEVIESAGYGFTESALEAVKMSTFSPAQEKGVSVASKALLTIRYVLKRG
jgi:protein TonB